LQPPVPGRVGLTSGQHDYRIIPLQQGKEGVVLTLQCVNNGNASSLSMKDFVWQGKWVVVTQASRRY